MDSYVTMHGNLVGDPVRTVTAAGHRVTKIRLASNGRRMDPQTREGRMAG